MILDLIGGKRREGAPAFYFLSEEENIGKLKEALASEEIDLISVEVPDWNRDMTPWPAEKVFGKGEDFSGGADEYLAELVKEIPAFEEREGLRPSERYLLGYSLAGLFAVYGALNSELFTGFASVSGSMWYDGFAAYVEGKAPHPALAKGYFSVGNREKNSKNPRMKTVEDCAARISGGLAERGIRTVFEINPGTHFTDPEGRIEKAVRWLLG